MSNENYPWKKVNIHKEAYDTLVELANKNRRKYSAEMEYLIEKEAKAQAELEATTH